MPDGYINGKVDTEWWMTQVRAGIEFRKKTACEAQWDTWRCYYRGDWDSDILPVNKSFAMLRSLVPRVYFRNPAVSVSPAMGGMLNMAFARILNRIDNKLLHQMKVKGEIKKCVQNTFMFGASFLKLGFGAQLSPNIESALGGGVNPKTGESFEYNPNVLQGMPWIKSAHPGNVIVPDGTMDFDDSRWIATWNRIPRSDLEMDRRFKNTKNLASTSRQGSVMKDPAQPGYVGGSDIEMVDVVEIRDRKFGRVFVLAALGGGTGRETLIFDGEDTLATRRHNLFPIIFNPDDEHFWGISDMKILEPYQLEQNEVRTQNMIHRRLSIAKLLYQEGAIDETEVAKMMHESVIGVKVKDLAGIKWEKLMMPSDLIAHEGQVEHSIREAIGFSRNQMGEFQTRRGDTSATEAAAVEQGSEIRVDERRDIIADVLTDVVEEMNHIIYANWTAEQVVDIVGPGGVPIWVRINPQLLRSGRYSVKVDPDSAVTRTRQQREAKATGVYNLLKSNPLIDPIKLTQYLLTELEGTEFDDLMAGLPALGQSPQGAVGVGEFANILRSSVQQVTPDNVRAAIAGG